MPTESAEIEVPRGASPSRGPAGVPKPVGIGWEHYFVSVTGEAYELSHPSERLVSFMARTARGLGYTLDKLRRKDKRPHVVKARAIVFTEAYNHPAGWNLTEIGRVLERDHTCVRHAISTLEPVAGDRELDDELAEVLV